MFDDTEGVCNRSPRRDAQKRREALIIAATEIFALHGYSVPLETIAKQAGVGRGTLYRNFRDREALALAVFSREVDQLEATLDPTLPIAETIAIIVRNGAPATSLFNRMTAELHSRHDTLEAFRTLGVRLETIIAPVIAEAQRRGEMSDGVTPRDMVLAMRMLQGLVLPFMTEAEVTAQISEAMGLLSDGLRRR